MMYNKSQKTFPNTVNKYAEKCLLFFYFPAMVDILNYEDHSTFTRSMENHTKFLHEKNKTLLSFLEANIRYS